MNSKILIKLAMFIASVTLVYLGRELYIYYNTPNENTTSNISKENIIKHDDYLITGKDHDISVDTHDDMHDEDDEQVIENDEKLLFFGFPLDLNQLTDIEKPKMVAIPAGEFLMGSNENGTDEQPIHGVTTSAFKIDQTETTVEQYAMCVKLRKCNNIRMRSDGCNYDDNSKRKFPMNCVTWFEAEKYCAFMEKRLPDEAEWEKAASWKDKVKYKYPTGKLDISCDDAIISNGGNGCGMNSSWRVKSRKKEINNTYDMAGNLREWTSSWYRPYPYKNLPSLEENNKKVIRGGGWQDLSDVSKGTYRNFNDPRFFSTNLGFRCVAD